MQRGKRQVSPKLAQKYAHVRLRTDSKIPCGPMHHSKKSIRFKARAYVVIHESSLPSFQIASCPLQLCLQQPLRSDRPRSSPVRSTAPSSRSRGPLLRPRSQGGQASRKSGGSIATSHRRTDGLRGGEDGRTEAQEKVFLLHLKGRNHRIGQRSYIYNQEEPFARRFGSQRGTRGWGVHGGKVFFSSFEGCCLTLCCERTPVFRSPSHTNIRTNKMFSNRMQDTTCKLEF